MLFATPILVSIYPSSVQQTTFDFSFAKLEEKEGIERERKGPRNPRHEISPSIDVRLQRRRMLSIYPSPVRKASESPDAPGQRRDGDRRPRSSASFRGLVTAPSAPTLSSDVSSIHPGATPKVTGDPIPPYQRLLSIPARPAVSPRSTPSRKSLC